MTSETSLRVNFMKFACAVMVVAIHCSWPWGRTWSPTWFANQVFIGSLCGIAVPFFFLCSGYFLAKHLGTLADWWTAVLKRVRTILVPFFIWTMIEILLFPLVLALLGDVLMGRPFCSTPLAFLRTYDWVYPLRKLIWMLPIVPLWYLKCLFVFVVIAPVVVFLTNRFGKKWLALCFILGLLVSLISADVPSKFFRFMFSVSGLFYFSAGLYLHKHPLYISCKLGGGQP